MGRVDVTIIGGGPVGLFAAFYAGMRGMSSRIVDSLPELGGQLTALYPEKIVFDMPGYPKVLAKDLAAAMAEQGLGFKPEVVLNETATSLEADAEGYAIRTDKGALLETRTVLISAGAGAFSPTKLGIPGEERFEGKGLSYGVKEKEAYRHKRVVIVGGGDSAFDWCLNLLSIAGSITLVHRRDEFRAMEDSVLRVRQSGVAMKLWTVVKELHGASGPTGGSNGGRLTAVTLENRKTGQCESMELDALVVNIGYKSSLGPIVAWGLQIEKSQIRVNPTTYETNLPGVYAVGDVCSYEGKLKLIATGVGEAVTAICFAKTRIDPSAKLFPGHSTEMDLGL